MKTDITYCCNTKCLHKIGCKRHLGNYNIPEKLLLSVFDGEACLNHKEDEMPFPYLVRFRLSNGRPMVDRKYIKNITLAMEIQ